MIYGLEQPVVPTMAVYDTRLMERYGDAVRDDYNTAKKDYNTFLDKYGDFYSPFESDMKYYYDNTLGQAKKLVDFAFSTGQDPFRNPQVQAAISNLRANVPGRELAAIRENAKNYAARQGLIQEMKAKGIYNEELEKADNQYQDPTSFKTINPDGTVNVYNATAPAPFMSLTDIASPFVKELAATEFLGPNKARGSMSRFYDLYGISDGSKSQALDAATAGVLQSPSGQLYVKRAKAAADEFFERTKPGEFIPENVRNAKTNEILRTMTEAAVSQYLQPKEVPNSAALTMYEAQMRMRAAAAGRAGEVTRVPDIPPVLQSMLGSMHTMTGDATAVDNGDGTMTPAFVARWKDVASNATNFGEIIRFGKSTIDPTYAAQYIGITTKDGVNGTLNDAQQARLISLNDMLGKAAYKSERVKKTLSNGKYGPKKLRAMIVSDKQRQYNMMLGKKNHDALDPMAKHSYNKGVLNAFPVHVSMGDELHTQLENDGRVHSYFKLYIAGHDHPVYIDTGRTLKTDGTMQDYQSNAGASQRERALMRSQYVGQSSVIPQPIISPEIE